MLKVFSLAVVLCCILYVQCQDATTAATTAAPTDATTAAPKDATTAAPKDATTAAPKDATTASSKDATTAAPKDATTTAEADTSVTTDATANVTDDTANATQIIIEPAFTRCLSEAAGNETVDDSNIVSILLSWCRDYKKVIPCLAEEIPLQREENALDFFISLRFNDTTMKKRSKDICKSISLVSDRILCAVNSSKIEAGKCTGRFKTSLRQIYRGYLKGVSTSYLKSLSCKLIHETTGCLDKTLNSCDWDVKQFLLMYYGLFTSRKCVYKPSDPSINEMAVEPITSICAKESSKLANLTGPVPTLQRDLVVRGMEADCQTYEARFECYERELVNPEHFWDRWLLHTFDLKNALLGHKEMCPHINETTELLTYDCFNQSEKDIMRCENDFTATADMIRVAEEERNMSESVVSDMACKATIGKAECYRKAFNVCNPVLAHVMAENIITPLPTKCSEQSQPGSDVTGTKPAETKSLPDVEKTATAKETGSAAGSSANKVLNPFCLLFIMTCITSYIT